MYKTLRLRLSYEQFADLESRGHPYQKAPTIRIDKQRKRVTVTFPRREDFTLARMSI
jgi:hypothetical protein